MPKQRFPRQEPSHEWEQIRPKLTDRTQLTYEVIRPVILWGETPRERSAQTGVPARTIYYKSTLFDQAGMASLLPPDPLPPVPARDKRMLPPDIRQEVVNLHTEYPALRPHELATICFVKFGRRCLGTPSSGCPMTSIFCVWVTRASMSIPTRVHNCHCMNTRGFYLTKSVSFLSIHT